MTQTKCLIMWSETASRAAIERMGLSQEEWAPRFYFDSQSGQRWDTIVIVTPQIGWKNCHLDWIDTALKTKTDNLVIL